MYTEKMLEVNRRRLYSYLDESEHKSQLTSNDDFSLMWGRKKSEPHYYTIPAGQKPVKVVFEGNSVTEDRIIQDWTMRLNDMLLKDIGIYDLNDKPSNECICESLL